MVQPLSPANLPGTRAGAIPAANSWRKPCTGSPGPCPRQGSRARRGEPPPTFDGVQIVIIEEDGKVQLVLGTAPGLVAWAVPTVGVGLLLGDVHGSGQPGYGAW